MAYKVSYIYEIIDNYSGPLSKINDKTNVFKKTLSALNKSGGLQAYNRNLSKTAKLYDGMVRPLTKVNQKIGQNTRSARGFNEQLTISRGNMKALRKEAAAFKVTMPRAPNIGGGGASRRGGGGAFSGMGGMLPLPNIAGVAAAVAAVMGPAAAYQAGSGFEYKMVSAMSKMGDVSDAQKIALRQSAFTEAKKSKFTTGDVATAIDTMAMSGFKVSEIIDSLGGVLRLSQSTETDVATSASIAAGTLRAFNMSAKEMPLVADMFASTAMSANTNVQELGDAMKYVGPIAAKMGYDLETMLAAIATVSDENIRGQMAGTSTRAIMTRLSADKNANAAMAAIGVNPRETTGEMKRFPALLKEINEGLKKVPRQNQEQFLTAMAGMEAISAFSIMLEKSDKIAMKELENRKALGTTERIQAIKQDTVLGQQERLGSAINVLLTNMGLLGNEAFNVKDKLKGLADFIGRQSDWFVVPEGAPEGTKSVAEQNLDKGIKGVRTGIPAFALYDKMMSIDTNIDTLKRFVGIDTDLNSSVDAGSEGKISEKSTVDVNIKVDSEGKATSTATSTGPSVGNLGVNMGNG